MNHDPDLEEEVRDDPDAYDLKLLIARLKDRIPRVDVRPVESQVRQLAQDLTLLSEEYTSQITGSQEDSFRGDSLLRRMANSAAKFIAASARLHNRSQATEEDVQCAWKMISFKLEVVKWFGGQVDRVRPLGPREQQVENARDQRQKRWLQILEDFGGSEGISADDIAEALECSLNIVQQELRTRGLRPKKGRYTIPTAAQYEEMQKEWEKNPDSHPDRAAGRPDEEPEEELDQEPEAKKDPEEAAREAAEAEQPKFEDSILPSPPTLAPVQKGIDGMVDEDEKQSLGEDLLRLATQEDAGGPGPELMVDGIVTTIATRSTHFRTMNAENAAEMKALLANPDRTIRGRNAIAIYAESSLPERLFFLEDEMKAHGPLVPELLRQDIDALIERWRWYRQKRLDEFRAAKKARESAEQEAYYKQFEPKLEVMQE